MKENEEVTKSAKFGDKVVNFFFIHYKQNKNENNIPEKVNDNVYHNNKNRNKISPRITITAELNKTDYSLEPVGGDRATVNFLNDEWVNKLFDGQPVDSLLKKLKPNFLTQLREDRVNKENFVAIYKPTLKIWDQDKKTQYITLYIKTVLSANENPKIISMHFDKSLYNEKACLEEAYNEEFKKEPIIKNPAGWDLINYEENRTYHHKVEVVANEADFNRDAFYKFLSDKYRIDPNKRGTTRIVERDITLSVPTEIPEGEHKTTLVIHDPVNGKKDFYCAKPLEKEIECFEQNYANLTSSQKEKLLKGEPVTISVPCIEIFNGHKIFRIQARNGVEVEEPLQKNLKSFSIFNKHIDDMEKEEVNEFFKNARVTLKDACDDLLYYYERKKNLEYVVKKTINECYKHCDEISKAKNTEFPNRTKE